MYSYIRCYYYSNDENKWAKTKNTNKKQTHKHTKKESAKHDDTYPLVAGDYVVDVEVLVADEEIEIRERS